VQENTTEKKCGDYWHSLWPKYFNNLDSLNSHHHHFDEYLGWFFLQLFWICLVTFHPSLLFAIIPLIILPYWFVIHCLATVHTMEMSPCHITLFFNQKKKVFVTLQRFVHQFELFGLNFATSLRFRSHSHFLNWQWPLTPNGL
jgi:hypothetical protein